MSLPFNEVTIEENVFIRTFLHNVDCGDLYWHRDREDRIIESINETDWMFQMENQLPINIQGKMFIPKGEWHRLIKGNGDLTIKLIKLKN
jgi:hypothetical protein